MHKIGIAKVLAWLLTVVAMFCSTACTNQDEALKGTALTKELQELRGHLKRFGVQLNENDKDEWLKAAVTFGGVEAVRQLIDRGANVNAEDEHGFTVVAMGCRYGSPRYRESPHRRGCQSQLGCCCLCR